ncbi:MAG TPA: TIM barrel protein [Kaistia sp.]|nr:TIM barrel protein [Kaistia sp.]
MTIRLANAPVSWGIWGANSLPAGRTPRDILHALADAGYAGVELGPLGFFGADAAAVSATLGEYGLACAGAYVPLRALEAAELVEQDFAALRVICKILLAFPNPGPVILAEETYPELKRHLRRGNRHPELDLSASDWRRLIDTIKAAERIATGYGLSVSFHPHTGTHIEQPHEVDRLLQEIDLGFTLDTGHAAAGGDDPLALLARWGSRVNHIHLKDVHLAPIERASADNEEFGIARASAALGAGDLDLDSFMQRLGQLNYSGWIVVEEDRRPDGGHDHAEVDREQRHNLDWVKARLGSLERPFIINAGE